jgi:NAD kinase
VLQHILFSDYMGESENDPGLDLRMRLKVNIADESKRVRKVFKGITFDEYDKVEIRDYHVINEVVIDRGPSPYSIQVEIEIDGEFLTTAVGDG